MLFFSYSLRPSPTPLLSSTLYPLSSILNPPSFITEPVLQLSDLFLWDQSKPPIENRVYTYMYTRGVYGPSLLSSAPSHRTHACALCREVYTVTITTGFNSNIPTPLPPLLHHPPLPSCSCCPSPVLCTLTLISGDLRIHILYPLLSTLRCSALLLINKRHSSHA